MFNALITVNGLVESFWVSERNIACIKWKKKSYYEITSRIQMYSSWDKKDNVARYPDKYFLPLLLSAALRAWTNDKCLATKHQQTLFGDQTFYRLDTLFGVVWSCLMIKFVAIKRKTFFCSRVWWAMFCSFGQPRINHVWCGHAYHACSAACICVRSNMF